MRFAERMMLSRRAVAARRGDAKSSHSAKGIFGHSRFGWSQCSTCSAPMATHSCSDWCGTSKR